MSDLTKLKIRLRVLRKGNSLTQQELATKIGVVRTAITNYESGRTIPDSETLSLLAKVLNTTTDFLLGISDIRNPYIDNSDKKDTFVNEQSEKYPEIHDVEEAMKIILDQPGLMLKGELLSDESKIILANAIQMGLRTAEELEKKKSKGDENE